MEKDQKIENKLAECCQNLLSNLERGDILNIPIFSLKLRQLLASVEKKYGLENENVPIGKVVSNLENIKLIRKALQTYTTFRDALKSIESAKSEDDLSIADGILELEKRIPMLWDYKTDTVFIEGRSKIKSVFTKALINAGQINIFSFNDEYIRDENNDEKILVNDIHPFILRSEKTFGLRAEFVFKDKDSLNRKFQKQVSDSLKHLHANFLTTRNFHKLWYGNNKNTFVNRLEHFSQKELEPFVKDRNILIVAPGPSLQYSIETIKDKGNEYFTIIAAAQSVNALEIHGIVPDFVMVVDPKDFSQVLENSEIIKSSYLIADDCIHPKFLEFPFKGVFTIVTGKESFGLQEIFKVEPFNKSGGTVTLTAAMIVSGLGAKSITFVGQDLAVSSGDYFMETKADFNQFKFEDGVAKIVGGSLTDNSSGRVFEGIPVVGWDDETLYTLPAYYNYLTAFTNFGEENPFNTELYNCSVGGAFIRGFEHCRLEELLDRISKHPGTVEDNSRNTVNKRYEAEKTLKKTAKIAGRSLKTIQKILELLRSKKAASELVLAKLDKLEQELISILGSHPKLKGIMLDTNVIYKEKLAGVDTLAENLQLSKALYRDLKKRFTQYRTDCQDLLEKIEKLK